MKLIGLNKYSIAANSHQLNESIKNRLATGEVRNSRREYLVDCYGDSDKLIVQLTDLL